MIRDTIDIWCDRCDWVLTKEEKVESRLSVLMAWHIRELEEKGWVFEYDEEDALKRVLCTFCAKIEMADAQVS